MKRFLAVLLAACMALALAGCSDIKEEQQPAEVPETSATDTESVISDTEPVQEEEIAAPEPKNFESFKKFLDYYKDYDLASDGHPENFMYELSKLNPLKENELEDWTYEDYLTKEMDDAKAVYVCEIDKLLNSNAKATNMLFYSGDSPVSLLELSVSGSRSAFADAYKICRSILENIPESEVYIDKQEAHAAALDNLFDGFDTERSFYVLWTDSAEFGTMYQIQYNAPSSADESAKLSFDAFKMVDESLFDSIETDDDKYGLGVTCYDEGQYKVGKDIPEGKYVLLTTFYSGYFAVTSDANGNDIVFNDNFDTNSIITIYDGEYLTLSRCIAVPEEEYHSKYVINYKDNTGVMLMVGTDIPAGEYKLTSEDGQLGYYCVYESSRQDKIVANDNFNNSAYVSVKDGQYLVLNRCYVSE